jgi:hypothetical protein
MSELLKPSKRVINSQDELAASDILGISKLLVAVPRRDHDYHER